MVPSSPFISIVFPSLNESFLFFSSINTLLEIEIDSDNSISVNSSAFLPDVIAAFRLSASDTFSPLNSQIAFKVILFVTGVLKSYFLPSSCHSIKK